MNNPHTLGVMNNPKSSVANLGVVNLGRMNNPSLSEASMNNNIPSLANLPLDTPSTGQTP